MSRKAPRRLPRAADRQGQGRRRAVLAPPQGHDDEGLRPDHLRPRRRACSSRTSSRSTAPRSPTLGVDLNNGFGDLVGKIDKLPADQKAAIEADIQAAYRRRPGARDGQLRQGHHQSPRAERRHRRRLDARDDPRRRQDVERPRARGQDTLAVIPDSSYAGVYQTVDRLLQEARRLRSEDDGLRAQRRPDGAGRRGVRLAQQDLPDRRRRHRPRRRRRRQSPARARTSRRATSGAPARPRTRRCRTG